MHPPLPAASHPSKQQTRDLPLRASRICSLPSSSPSSPARSMSPLDFSCGSSPSRGLGYSARTLSHPGRGMPFSTQPSSLLAITPTVSSTVGFSPAILTLSQGQAHSVFLISHPMTAAYFTRSTWSTERYVVFREVVGRYSSARRSSAPGAASRQIFTRKVPLSCR